MLFIRTKTLFSYVTDFSQWFIWLSALCILIWLAGHDGACTDLQNLEVEVGGSEVWPAWVLHKSCLKRPKVNKETDSICIHGLSAVTLSGWWPAPTDFFLSSSLVFLSGPHLHFTQGQLVCFFWGSAEFCILVREDRSRNNFLAGLFLHPGLLSFVLCFWRACRSLASPPS